MGCCWHWASCHGCCWWHCWVVVVVGWRKEVMSQIVTLVWCLNLHVRLHVQSHVIFLQFTVKTPQSWSSPGPVLSRGEIQPSGLVWVLLSLGQTHLPTSTSENYPSLAELGRNYRGTIKTLTGFLFYLFIEYQKLFWYVFLSHPCTEYLVFRCIHSIFWFAHIQLNNLSLLSFAFCPGSSEITKPNAYTLSFSLEHPSFHFKSSPYLFLSWVLPTNSNLWLLLSHLFLLLLKIVLMLL